MRKDLMIYVGIDDPSEILPNLCVGLQPFRTESNYATDVIKFSTNEETNGKMHRLFMAALENIIANTNRNYFGRWIEESYNKFMHIKKSMSDIRPDQDVPGYVMPADFSIRFKVYREDIFEPSLVRTVSTTAHTANAPITDCNTQFIEDYNTLINFVNNIGVMETRRNGEGADAQIRYHVVTARGDNMFDDLEQAFDVLTTDARLLFVDGIVWNEVLTKELMRSDKIRNSSIAYGVIEIC